VSQAAWVIDFSRQEQAKGVQVFFSSIDGFLLPFWACPNHQLTSLRHRLLKSSCWAVDLKK